MAALSVIVCTRDRRPGLMRCLKSITDSAQASAWPVEMEIVVVDDGSQDGTAEAVQAFAAREARTREAQHEAQAHEAQGGARVRLIRQPGCGLSAARNTGVDAARGELLAFIDDDCIASPGYVGEVVARFAGERELVLRGGRVALGDPLDAPLTINPSNRTERLAQRANVGGFILGCNMAMRREVLERLGPFDERLGAGAVLRSGEDTDLLIRALLADIPLEFTGDMTVHHFHGRRTREQILHAWRNYDIGNGALMAKHLGRAPWFLRNGYWNLRNALREPLGGPMFDEQLSLSHGPITLHNLLGALMFAGVKLRGERAVGRRQAAQAPLAPVPAPAPAPARRAGPAATAKSEPLISVVLPVYNGGRHLEPAVVSVLEQDHRAMEVIVIDDGSTDESLEVLQRLAAADPRLRIVSRENRGLIATLNEGIALSRGAFIARMDADDICYPARFSRQLELFRARPDMAMNGTDFHILLGDEGPLDSMTESRPDAELPILSQFFTAFRHSTVMFNRAVMAPGLLRYDASYPHAEDFDLFRRITARSPVGIVREPLLAYRIHPDSVTGTSSAQMRRTHLRILSENLERMGVRVKAPALMVLKAQPAYVLDQMVRMFEQVRALAERAPATQRPAFELGRDTLFFFLREMAIAEFGMGFACDFLDRTEGWRRMRRRETYALKALRGAPMVAEWTWSAMCGWDRQALRRRSRRLSRVLVGPLPLPAGGQGHMAL
jgi:glycosyltransferase involved in cell wall biosynthesis